MSNQMPELGAKISLISKADIRYEGRLFQVDPKECTIALANVRSFGTEDRETIYPVPAQSQIYEYILFRGSDIKDIRILPPQDPAIVQAMPQPTQPAFSTPGLGHSMLGQSMHPLGGFSGYGGGLGGLTRPPGPLMMQQQSELGPVARPNEHPYIGPSIGEKEPGSVVEMLVGGSRSTTPLTRKSPTMDQGTQVNKSPPREDSSKQPKPIQPPERDNRGRRDQSFYQASGQHQQAFRPREGDNRRPFHENNRIDYHRNDSYNRRPNNFRRDNRDGPDDQYQNRDYNRGYQNRQGHEGNWIPRSFNNQGPMNRPQGGPRGRGSRGSGRPMNSSSGTLPANKKNPLKFEDEYDFDKANTEFEELRSQLNKIKITAEEGIAVDGKEADKEEPAENGTTEAEAEHEVFYDKSKSFFDCISCEAVERSKGRSQRTDWRTERKLNTETFGVSSARRGMYRGRGYYHGNRNYGYRPRNNQQGQGDAAPATGTAPL